MKKEKENQSAQSDGSGGEKMSEKHACPRCVDGKMVIDNESNETFCSRCGFKSEKPTLPKKGFQSVFGEMDDTEENKKMNFGEIGHAEDRRVVDAEIALRARLSSKEREEALEWQRNFSVLIGEWSC